MARFKSGIHTRIELLIERSGGYNREYHIDKLKEISDMSLEDIFVVMDFTHNYEEQVQIINGIKEGDIKLETVLKSSIAKKEKNKKDLEDLLGMYNKVLRKSGMGTFYMDMLKQGF